MPPSSRSAGMAGRTPSRSSSSPRSSAPPIANIRWAAVTAIGKLGDYRVIDHLLKAVEDPEWIVRTQAVTELMGKVQDSSPAGTSGWPRS